MEISLGKSQSAFIRTNDRSGLIVKSPMYTVLIDTTGFALPENFRPDLILVTHEHSHHFDENFIFSLYKAMKNNSAGSTEQKPYGVTLPEGLPPIVSDQTTAVFLRRFLSRDVIKVLGPGEELSMDMLTIAALRSEHPTAKTPLTYMIILDNGMRIFHASDSLPNEDMEAASQQEPDIAFVPIGLDPRVGPMSGAQIARDVHPDVVVPFHGSDVQRFKAGVKRLARDVPVRTFRPGEIEVYG